MKINFGQKMNFVNSNISVKKSISPMVDGDSRKKDSISIGLQARQLFNGSKQKNSMIESLMKQRESIQEMKSKLTERTLENGGDLSGIKEQLKAFEEQIAEIDAQIAQAQKENENNSPKKEQATKAKTPEEAIFTQAGTLEQVKTLGRTDRTLSREKATLESQMKSDAQRGVHSEYKENRLAKVEDQISTVQEELSEKVNQVASNSSEEIIENKDTFQETIDKIIEKKQDESENKGTSRKNEDSTSSNEQDIN